MVVTGAASGIGRAIAARLAGEGWSVVAVDRDAGGLDEAAGEHVLPVVADVGTEAGNAAMVDAAGSAFGGLDGAVLNAGVAGTGTIDGGSLDDFDRIVAVNLRGVLLGMRAAVPALRARGGGSIVATASVSGLRADPGLHAYNASKAGVVNLVRSAALDLGSAGIRVNAV